MRNRWIDLLRMRLNGGWFTEEEVNELIEFAEELVA
jgi:hypothetical protein